jgi:deoxyadenosine/deoxycytidine kinase
VEPKFIVVSGLIGAGKTTFTKSLAEHLGYKAMFEPVESNPYLARFYEDPKRWAYPMQEYLKHRRFASSQYAYWGIRCGEFKGVVLDRSIHEDTVFAEINKDIGNIHDLDWNTYLQGFQDFQAFLPEPDMYIFLDVPPELARTRVLQRARPEEQASGLAQDAQDENQGIPLAYLKTLHQGYLKWIEAIAPRMQVVRVDWKDFRPADETWADVEKQFAERSRFTRSLVTSR